jgi:quercetin dioxygenase-like cupin family protein
MTSDNRTPARDVPGATTDQSPLHRPAGTGATYLGPGDVYRFLVTGAETGGAYFAMEAIVAPGGGPPPHIHHREDETFSIVEGECRLLLGDEWITAGVGDLVHVPRGAVHCFRNESTETMRMIVTFTPAGIESFFQETLQLTQAPTADIPDDIDAIAARYAAAAPRYGIQFVIDNDPRAAHGRNETLGTPEM